MLWIYVYLALNEVRKTYRYPYVHTYIYIYKVKYRVYTKHSNSVFKFFEKLENEKRYKSMF